MMIEAEQALLEAARNLGRLEQWGEEKLKRIKKLETRCKRLEEQVRQLEKMKGIKWRGWHPRA